VTKGRELNQQSTIPTTNRDNSRGKELSTRLTEQKVEPGPNRENQPKHQMYKQIDRFYTLYDHFYLLLLLLNREYRSNEPNQEVHRQADVANI